MILGSIPSRSDPTHISDIRCNPLKSAKLHLQVRPVHAWGRLCDRMKGWGRNGGSLGAEQPLTPYRWFHWTTSANFFPGFFLHSWRFPTPAVANFILKQTTENAEQGVTPSCGESFFFVRLLVGEIHRWSATCRLLQLGMLISTISTERSAAQPTRSFAAGPSDATGAVLGAQRLVQCKKNGESNLGSLEVEVAGDWGPWGWFPFCHPSYGWPWLRNRHGGLGTGDGLRLGGMFWIYHMNLWNPQLDRFWALFKSWWNWWRSRQRWCFFDDVMVH